MHPHTYSSTWRRAAAWPGVRRRPSGLVHEAGGQVLCKACRLADAVDCCLSKEALQVVHLRQATQAGVQLQQRDMEHTHVHVARVDTLAWPSISPLVNRPAGPHMTNSSRQRSQACTPC
eukprot:365091-Chlamydomonas_euryale.AAC.22